MTDIESHIRSLIEFPRESLVVEIKDWIDPKTPEGVAKIVKAAQALRNADGGFLIVGFNDKSLTPTPPPQGFDVQTDFHQDLIQGLISRYSSILFEVMVHLVPLSGNLFPVIQVSSGVVCPVLCKADLKDAHGKPLLVESSLYVRTLASNGTPSTARASWRDYDALVQRCFDNREADPARFLSKVFRALSPDVSKAVIQNLAGMGEQIASSGFTVEEMLSYGAKRFDSVVSERNVNVSGVGFFEVALRIESLVQGHQPNQKFLELVRSANPDLTGWPIWLVSSSFADIESHPYLFDERWEEFLFREVKYDIGGWGHLDFMVFDPKGAFYLKRALQDDMGGKHAAEVSGNYVEPIMQLLRVGEALAVGQQFAKAMGLGGDVSLSFVFRWTGLKGRRLALWAHPDWTLHSFAPSKQDDAKGSVRLPVASGEDGLVQASQHAMLGLSRSFGGYEIPARVFEHFIPRLLHRKL